jgi:hypothetical protein
MDSGLKPLRVWENSNQASKHYDVSVTCISKACRKNIFSIGFYWRYISRKEYKRLCLENTEPPKIKVDKRKRDLSKAQEAKIKGIKAKYTKKYLLSKGLKCLEENGSLTRYVYDRFAKENDSLTYIPVSNRFGGFKSFKDEVYKIWSKN